MTEQPPEPGILTQDAPAPRAADGGLVAVPAPPAGPPAEPGAPTEPATPAPEPDEAAPFAAWWRRAAATLLDGWLVGTVTFLLGGTFDSSWIIVRFGSPTRVSQPTVAWWATWALLLVLQAYTGSTPGKRAMGISIVREVDGRPLGQLRTLGRELAHLVDALTCFVGYLRPLWHARRRTFADSIAGSDALVTRSPTPHRAVEWLRERVPLPSGRFMTSIAGAVCTIAVLGALSAHGGESGLDEGCVGDPAIQGTATGEPVLGEIAHVPGGGWTSSWSAVDDRWLTSPTPRLLEARAITSGWTSEERLGITRRHQSEGGAMFWWAYGGPVRRLTAVLGPTRPDGSRSPVDEAHSVRLEVDLDSARGVTAFSINGGSVSPSTLRPGVVGVYFEPSTTIETNESFGWTAAVEPAGDAGTVCSVHH